VARFYAIIRMIILLLLVAIFVMCKIFGIFYESYVHPLMVSSSLNVAMLGGLILLFIAKDIFHWKGMELSLYACIMNKIVYVARDTEEKRHYDY
jgi:multidrug efflux pump subunit AcrB